jgi:hypothetical protein
MNLESQHHDYPFQITLESEYKHNVMGALTGSYPEVEEALKRARVCVVQYTYWPSNPEHRHYAWRRNLSAIQKQVRLQWDPVVLPYDVQPVFLGYVRAELGCMLRGREGLKIAGMPVLGWMGFYEGGMDFFGADDTRIRTEDWEGARDYVLSWCAERWKN